MFPSSKSATALSKFLQQAVIHSLGGDDFDQTELWDYLVCEFKKAGEGIDLSDTTKWQCRELKEAAEKAKKELSTVTSSNINLPFITMNQDGPKHLDVTLTRAKFDELTADLVDKTMGPVRHSTFKTQVSAAGELDKDPSCRRFNSYSRCSGSC